MDEISEATAVVLSEKELLGLFGATALDEPALVQEMSI
jgi:hypothetical protein